MKSFRIPVFILLLTFLLSLLAGSSIRRCAQTWQQQLSLAEAAAEQQDWPKARAVLEDLHDRWQEKQKRLHMLAEHEELDEVETLLCRCLVLARLQEGQELSADLAELSARLTILKENQGLSLRNIL
mgnify:CR=1 FL=1